MLFESNGAGMIVLSFLHGKPKPTLAPETEVRSAEPTKSASALQHLANYGQCPLDILTDGFWPKM